MIISYESLNIYIYVNDKNEVWGIELNNKCYSNIKRIPTKYTGNNLYYKDNYMFKLLCFVIDVLLKLNHKKILQNEQDN